MKYGRTSPALASSAEQRSLVCTFGTQLSHLHYSWQLEAKVQTVTLKVCEHQFVVIPSSKEVVGTGGKANGAHILWMWFETLHVATASDIVEHTWRILMAWYQKSPWWVYTHSSHWRALHYVTTEVCIASSSLFYSTHYSLFTEYAHTFKIRNLGCNNMGNTCQCSEETCYLFLQRQPIKPIRQWHVPLKHRYLSPYTLSCHINEHRFQ